LDQLKLQFTLIRSLSKFHQIMLHVINMEKQAEQINSMLDRRIEESKSKSK